MSSSLAQELQDIKKKHEEDMAEFTKNERRKEALYNTKLTNYIVKAIMEKRVRDGNRIYINMRMDEKRPLHVVEINALLKEHYIKVRNIYVHSTECNSCIVNPSCCCCCPCIFFPKVVINALFGTLYSVDVYLNI